MKRSNLYIIIQARMTSTRLPGKVMLPLCGKSVLEVMFERLKRFHEHLIVATTDDGSEAPIVELCKRMNIRSYRGSIHDVLSRYYHAALAYGAEEDDIVVRLTSDCPLVDPDIVQRTIDFFIREKSDLTVAGPHSGFPRGMDTAVFRFALLKRMQENAVSDYDREHVTPYAERIAGELKIVDYTNTADHSRYRLTLDEPDDYRAIREVYRLFDDSVAFTYEALMAMLESHPHIYEMNKHVEQKKRTDDDE